MAYLNMPSDRKFMITDIERFLRADDMSELVDNDCMLLKRMQAEKQAKKNTELATIR